MISVGACIGFCVLAAVVGVILGAYIAETHRSPVETGVADKWKEIDRAATEAYNGAWADAREATGLPLLVTTNEAGPLGTQFILNRDGFEAWAGVAPDRLLRALGRDDLAHRIER